MPRVTWSTHREPDDADRHAPQDRHDYMRAAADLATRGLTLDDIAAALRLTRAGVMDLLREYAERQAGPPEVEIGHLTRRRKHGG